MAGCRGGSWVSSVLGVHAQVIRPLSLGLGASLAIAGICWALEMGMSGPQVVQFKC